MIEEHLTTNDAKHVRLILRDGNEIFAQPTATNGSGKSALLDDWVAAKKADGTTVEIIQEIAFPSVILLQQMEGVGLPPELSERGLNDNWISNQFKKVSFEQPADIHVFSLLPDITAEIWKHKTAGYHLLPPADWQQQWTAEQRDWLQANFTACGLCSVEQFKEDFTRIVEHIQQNTEAQVMVFGVSSYDPADNTHNYHAVQDTPSLRAHRFNHALVQLSQDLSISILDVDRLIAEIGGKDHVRRVFSYSPEGNQIIAQELFRIIEDIGYFDNHPLLKLTMPQIDLQFQTGSIVKWHKREGKWVDEGDTLFDLRVEEIMRSKRSDIVNLDEARSEEITSDQWKWMVRVTAADKGFFRKKLVSEKEFCSAGDLLAIFSVRDNERLNYNDLPIEDAPTLRVVTNILEKTE